jgi:hypothetical protein
MAEVILSTSPHLHRASLGTGRCEACRTVLAPASRTRTSGERKSALGHRVHPDTPRAVERAKAAERPEPQRWVGRAGSAVVGPSTGQRPTGGEGAPKAAAVAAGGTREAPWVVGPADSTRRTAGQGPGGTGCGRQRRPSGHRRERTEARRGATRSAWEGPQRHRTTVALRRPSGPRGTGNRRRGESQTCAVGSSERPKSRVGNRGGA